MPLRGLPRRLQRLRCMRRIMRIVQAGHQAELHRKRQAMLQYGRGQQSVYLVELTGALEQPDAPAAQAAAPLSGDSAAQAGAGSAPPRSKPAAAPDGLQPTSSDAGLAELAGDRSWR